VVSAAMEALEQLAESGAMPAKYVEAVRTVLFENAAVAIRNERRQDELEALLLGHDVVDIAEVLIRRLTPGQLTDLGTRLLVAGS
jgi:hypothetical protein